MPAVPPATNNFLGVDMKRQGIVITLVSAICLLGMQEAIARDTKNMWPIADAMGTPDARAKLDKGIKFFFGKSAHPAVARTFGEFTSNKKTNGANKKDKEACEWAFLSAMISFQERAVAEGGDAVINITSYYKKNDVSSETEYECGSGALMSGVTFRGEVVKLK